MQAIHVYMHACIYIYICNISPCASYVVHVCVRNLQNESAGELSPA